MCGQVELTPMSIATEQRLSNHIFGGIKYKEAKEYYDNVSRVVFYHHTIGSVGPTEPESVVNFGEENMKVYTYKFANLHFGILDVPSLYDRPRTIMKIVCATEDENVVGIRVPGMGADDMMQVFCGDINMGETKAELDSFVAIHTKEREELVTMGNWDMRPQVSGDRIIPLNGVPQVEPNIKSKI